MMRAYEGTPCLNHELVWRPVERPALVRAAVQVCPDAISDPEYRDVTPVATGTNHHFFSGFRVNFPDLA